MFKDSTASEDVLAFCVRLREIVDGKPLRGRSGKLVTPEGVSTLNNLLFLRNILLKLKPSKTLEVGLAYGGSALLFAATHRNLGHAPSGQHIAIDPFQANSWDECGLIVLEDENVREYVDFRSSLSCVALPDLLAQGTKIDLAYVDGSHLFENVFIDLYYITRLLNEGGIVIFDDSVDPHVHKVLKFIRNNATSTFLELDAATFRSDQGKSWRFRVGKLLGRTQLSIFKKIGAADRAWNALFSDF